jgi:hypothetical protein
MGENEFPNFDRNEKRYSTVIEFMNIVVDGLDENLKFAQTIEQRPRLNKFRDDILIAIGNLMDGDTEPARKWLNEIGSDISILDQIQTDKTVDVEVIKALAEILDHPTN